MTVYFNLLLKLFFIIYFDKIKNINDINLKIDSEIIFQTEIRKFINKKPSPQMIKTPCCDSRIREKIIIILEQMLTKNLVKIQR